MRLFLCRKQNKKACSTVESNNATTRLRFKQKHHKTTNDIWSRKLRKSL